MTEDYAIVVGGANRNIWHEPADESSREAPVAKCHDEHGMDCNWVTRRREIATAWYDKCAYCSGEFQAATDQWTAPTEVQADD